MIATAAGHPHDLILLDLQMPELDGYEAVRLLRASAWPGAILALSAHISTDDRERCREAGFDEFLPKPVTRAALLAAVRRHVQSPGRRSEGRPVAKGSSATAPQQPEAAAGERNSSSLGVPNAPGAGPAFRLPSAPPAGEHLRLAPGAASISDSPEAERGRLLALFANQLPPRLALLEQSLRDQDRQRLRQTAHQLAGAAGQFGFPQLAAAAEGLELSASKAASWDELAIWLDRIREALPAHTTARDLPTAGLPATEEALRRHRVVVVEDDELVRAGLRNLVSSLAEFEVVGEAANGREALERLRQLQPEIVLMDIAMPDLDGLNATVQVIAAAAQTKIIIVSTHSREDTVLQAVRAGAVGYLLKNASPRELEQALLAVARGETYYCAAVSEHLVGTCRQGAHSKPAKSLTPRQLEVLKLIAEGLSTKMIAHKLGISIKTADHHRAKLMALLDIHDTASLVRYAFQLGLVTSNR